eukprot:SAG31_NODE_1367_length_8615_cov_12.875763_8_plen_55_part_00
MDSSLLSCIFKALDRVRRKPVVVKVLVWLVESTPNRDGPGQRSTSRVDLARWGA